MRTVSWLRMSCLTTEMRSRSFLRERSRTKSSRRGSPSPEMCAATTTGLCIPAEGGERGIASHRTWTARSPLAVTVITARTGSPAIPAALAIPSAAPGRTAPVPPGPKALAAALFEKATCPSAPTIQAGNGNASSASRNSPSPLPPPSLAPGSLPCAPLSIGFTLLPDPSIRYRGIPAPSPFRPEPGRRGEDVHPRGRLHRVGDEKVHELLGLRKGVHHRETLRRERTERRREAAPRPVDGIGVPGVEMHHSPDELTRMSVALSPAMCPPFRRHVLRPEAQDLLSGTPGRLHAP